MCGAPYRTVWQHQNRDSGQLMKNGTLGNIGTELADNSTLQALDRNPTSQRLMVLYRLLALCTSDREMDRAHLQHPDQRGYRGVPGRSNCRRSRRSSRKPECSLYFGDFVKIATRPPIVFRLRSEEVARECIR